MQGEAKEEMMLAMGLNTEEEGSAMAFLRRGYKARLPQTSHSCSSLPCILQCIAGQARRGSLLAYGERQRAVAARRTYCSST